MNFLDKAIEILQSDNTLTCVVCSDDFLWMSSQKGVKPLVELIESKIDISHMALADIIVGKAAALLYVLMGVNEVYAEVISESAIKVLEANHITYRFNKVVPQIINREGNDMCPMEKATLEIDEPAQALISIKNKIAELAEK